MMAWRRACYCSVCHILASGADPPFNRLWLKLGLVLHKIVNPVVMTVLFVSTIVPVDLLMRPGGEHTLACGLGRTRRVIASNATRPPRRPKSMGEAVLTRPHGVFGGVVGIPSGP
jgi:hypothetical protein